MAIVSISLADPLLKRVDSLVSDKGFSSRSEAVRDALRNYLSEYELNKFQEGWITATITAISEHESHEVGEKLTRVRHQHSRVVFSNMHIHLSDNYCLEIFITQGEAADILDFVSRIRAIQGIQQVRYTTNPIVRPT
ncbi:MAG: nickel-responsive transcriptional regulator NikR [Thaumarchaeota archaeon]|nr:nickel-responsive transcriptional regulator NikR [Nitrososphaerota archaeon]